MGCVCVCVWGGGGSGVTKIDKWRKSSKERIDFHVTSSISSLDFPIMLSRINWTGSSGTIVLFRGFVVTTMKGSPS